MRTVATSALRAILVGGLVAGTLDIGAAALINAVSPVLITHYIASGVLGKESFAMGAPAACLGLLLQWAMSIVIAAIYWQVAARMPRLRARWWAGGLLAGIVIFLVMNFIVMPFSAAPVTLHQVIARLRVAKAAENLLAMFVFGLIVAYCARPIGSRRGSESAAKVGVPLSMALLPLCLLAVHSSAASVPAAAVPVAGPDPVTLIASAREAIEAANSGWLPAMERADATAVAAAYAEDGLLITSNGTAIRGRSAIAARYRAEFADLGRVTAGGLVQEGVTVSGGLIYEWGHGWLVFTQKDGKRRVSSGPYFTVWRRGTDGTWAVIRNLVL